MLLHFYLSMFVLGFGTRSTYWWLWRSL